MERDNELLVTSLIGGVVFILVFLVASWHLNRELLTLVNCIIVFCSGFTVINKVFAWWDKQIIKKANEK